ncbi:MAG: 4-carboxymuconolactone decarboxylase domain protein [Actinomycetia bacterium]|nr:4-carboxymuconolactone decarboxylase domain protein [Actinomycetes bacterium]
MTFDQERHELGQRMFAEVTGRAAPAGPTTPLIEMTVDHVCGEIWSRPGLTRKERRFVTITAVASAGAELALQAHVDAALDSGDLSIEELRELVLHFAAYQGYPRATVLHFAVEKAASRDLRQPES